MGARVVPPGPTIMLSTIHAAVPVLISVSEQKREIVTYGAVPASLGVTVESKEVKVAKEALQK